MSIPTIIVGAAGGIGQALSRLLAPTRPLILISRENARVTPLAQELGATAVEVAAEDREALTAVVKQHAIDGQAAVVNLAGSLLLKPAHRTSADEFATLCTTHLTTAFNCVAAAGEVCRKGGAVVLIGSAAGRLGLANHEGIAAVKAGVEGMARSAAASYSKRGLRVNVVSPGLVDTPLAAGLTSNPASKKASEAMHALGRIGQPEDIAKAIHFALDAEWMTGQVLGVDGGLATVRS